MHFYVMCGTALVTLFKGKQEQLRSVCKLDFLNSAQLLANCTFYIVIF